MLKDLNYTKYNFPLTSPTTKKYQYFKFVVNAIQAGNTLQMAELILDYTACAHQWEDTQEVHEATCTEGAYKIQKCKVCEIEKKVVTSEPLGHKFDENGICTVCNEKRSIEINEENFPDENFREYIKQFDQDKDQSLSIDEIAAVTEIMVAGKPISDLKGIEYFTALTSLDCFENQLSKLDVSKNTKLKRLRCSSNMLTAIDVSKNTELTDLYCYSNKLTELDVSQNTKLEVLICNSNKLTKLDVSQNTKLVELNCSSNMLTAIDLTNNLLIDYLTLDNNPIISLACGTARPYIWADKLAPFEVTEGKEFALADHPEINSDNMSNVSGGTLKNGIITPDENSSKVTYEYKYDDNGNTITCSIGFGLAINAANFPDERFRNWLLEQDYGEDGVLTADELSSVEGINIRGRLISDLTGIEYFTSLKTLHCYSNNLTSLDLSKNTALTELTCNNNKLTALDVSKNTALTVLNCSNNGLTTLDLNKNTALTKLNCGNNELTALDVSKNTALTELWCNQNHLETLNTGENAVLGRVYCYNNNLTAFDMSGLTVLTELKCSENRLTTLNVSENKMLRALDCNYNDLKALDVSENTELFSLKCSNNLLTKLDVSKNTGFTELFCNSNRLETLDVSKNTALIFLNCSNNQLETLDVSQNTKLSEFTCTGNELETLDLSKNTELAVLDFSFNEFTELDLSKNTGLIELNCEANQLTSLDVSQNTKLTKLYCSSNELTKLDVSNNTALTDLYCGSNQLTTLDISQNTALVNLYCYNNRLTTLDIRGNTNVKSLACDNNPLVALNCGNVTISVISASPLSMLEINDADTFDISKYGGSAENIISDSITGGKIDENGIITPDENSAKVTYKYKYIDNGDTITCSIAFGIAIDEVNFPDEIFRNYVKIDIDQNDDEVLTADEISSVQKIDVSHRFISDLKGIEHFTALTELNCSYNQLITLDLSKNTLLTTLDCQENNQLTTLDLSKNTLLTTLNCNSNQLTTLDLSKNTLLKELDCRYNDIKKLDISKNVDLTSLKCGNNKLIILDVSNNTELTELDCNYNQLKSLDISKNTLLTNLTCYVNQLTSLDISKNTNLTELYCSSNRLTKLDVSKNTLLTVLNCYYNPLTSLDLSATAVTDLSANTTFKEYAYKTVFDGGKLDLTTLDGFDVSKASEWSNATIEGNVISIIDPANYVTYTYDTGKGNARFMIAAESVSLTADMIEVEDQTYTGEKIEPKPVVKCGDYTLVEGTDYTLSYDKNTEAGTGKVIVTAKGDFYTGSAEAEFKINKATPAEIIPPTASGLIYGQELSESMLSDENWSWVDGKVIPTVNNDGYDAVIEVDDKNYDYSDVEGYNEKDHTVTRTIEVTVKKATPVEIIPPTASGLTYGQKLSESVLSDENWKWVDGTVIPTVNNDGYEASIIVDDKNYDYSDVEGYNEKDHTVARTIEVTVKKATPAEIILPTASGLTYGQKLSESTLSDENWKWVDGKVISTVNNDGYEASIIVDDKNYDYSDVEGYNEKDHTVARTIEVTVKKAAPAEIILPTSSGLTYGQKLSESVLSDKNWYWVYVTIIPTVNNEGYDAVIEVDDKNYDYSDVEGYNEEDHTVTRIIEVTVEKADPIVNPVIDEADYEDGDDLPEIRLSENDTFGNIEWIEKIAKLVEGKNILDWKFTPEDENYNDVTGTLIVNAKATTTTTTTVTTTTTTAQSTTEKATTNTSKATTTKATTASTTQPTTVSTTKATTSSTTQPTTVSTTKLTIASATKLTTAVTTTKATTTSITKPTTVSTTKATTTSITKSTTVSTTKATAASTTKPTTAVSTTKATTANTTQPTTAVSTTKATTASTTQTTTVSTTKATTSSTTKPTAVSTTKATTANTTQPTTVSTTKATTASTTKSTTVSTTKATTANTTKPTTVSTTKATTANTTQPTAVSTTKATTASTTKPTTAVTTTKATTANTTKPTTTISTTKATAASTTKPTTVSTTKATTASTTQTTTVSTTKTTTVSTTQLTTVSTTKATTANTTGTTVSSSTSTSTSVSTTSTTATSTTSAPTTTTVPPTTTPQVTEVLGDANDDGKLDVRDAAYIARMLAQRNADKLPAKADFNGDGKIDVRDAAAIARFLANNHKNN